MGPPLELPPCARSKAVQHREGAAVLVQAEHGSGSRRAPAESHTEEATVCADRHWPEEADTVTTPVPQRMEGGEVAPVGSQPEDGPVVGRSSELEWNPKILPFGPLDQRRDEPAALQRGK